MELRPYQIAAVNSIFEYFERGESGHPVIEMPTGTGKSLVIASLTQRALEYHGTRVLMLTHVKELITQNLDKLLRIWPDAPVGVYSAGLNMADTESPILFCGIQSVWNKAAILTNEDKPIELVFIDECHRVPFTQESTYRRFIQDLTEINPHIRIIGLTATPHRHVPSTETMSSGYQLLTEGDGRLFTDLVFELSKSFKSLIDDDYLAALWPAKTKYQVELKGIKVEKGDYKIEELNALMNTDGVMASILDEGILRAQADNRGHWLIFCTGIESAHFAVHHLNMRGISAAVVESNTSDRDRATYIADFQSGQLTALVSVNVLTTGFDAPITDCLIIARPTYSPVLYAQIMGRGMRPTDSKIAIDGDRKRGCLVLDFVGNVNRHGAIDHLTIYPPQKKGKQPDRELEEEERQKTRAKQSVNTLPIMECLTETLPNSLLPTDPIRYEITRVAYFYHMGKSGIPTLRVNYYSGMLRVISEWVCLEHTGFARRRAEEWWLERRYNQSCIPANVESALKCQAEFGIKEPIALWIQESNIPKVFPKIVKYEWFIK